MYYTTEAGTEPPYQRSDLTTKGNYVQEVNPLPKTETQRSVVVPVAQRRPCCIQNLSNRNIWAESIHIDVGIERQGTAGSVGPIDAGDTRVTTVVLPNAEITIDKAVMLHMVNLS